MPIMVDGNQIVAGHCRALAAQKLWDSNSKLRMASGEPIPDGAVPVMDCSGWSAAQVRAYVIADNKLALNAGWDFEMLAVEIDELRDMAFDLDKLGFEAAELNDLVGTPKEPPEEKAGSDNYIIQYNIVFDDEQQQDKWFEFVRILKEKFPDAETIGERIAYFVNELDNHG
jgi:hypothetical protein